MSLSKTLYLHCISRLSCEISTRWRQPREGSSVLCTFRSYSTALTHAFFSCLFGLLHYSFQNCLQCTLSGTPPVLCFSGSSSYSTPSVELHILFILYCSFLALYRFNLCAMAVSLHCVYDYVLKALFLKPVSTLKILSNLGFPICSCC